MPLYEQTHIGYLSVGSNLGARETAVLKSIKSLSTFGDITVSKISSLYETAPVACSPQPFFINMVVEVKSLLSPADLLNRLKQIEHALGRSGGHGSAREIDLDIISYGSFLIDTPELLLPHPRFHERAFVLIPLREIAPGFYCPRRRRVINDLMPGIVSEQGIARITSRRIITL